MAPRTEYLSRIDLKTARGLEFGPADRPWIPASTPGIRYIDHLSTEDLKKKYTGWSDYNAADFCEIHFVNDGRPLPEILGDWVDLDVVAASHVIEHIPNLLKWLLELGSILKPGGLLFLAAPNKRFEFDRLRRVTELNDVLANYLEDRKRPSAWAMLDYWIHYANLDGAPSWAHEVEPSALTLSFPVERCYSEAKIAVESPDYKDVHVSAFTPYSFVQILRGLSELKLLPFELESIETSGMEFLAMLRACRPDENVELRLKKLDKESEHLPFNIDDYFSGLLFLGDRKPDDLAGRPSGTASAELRRVQEELASLKSSSSWRITAPLRRLRSLFG
jgi:SAM-dependent methyltransferase